MTQQTTRESTRAHKEGQESERVHVWLYSDDVRWIDENIDKVKRSKFIRLAVRAVVRSVQEKAARQHKAMHAEEEEITND